jgi:hypothetical protein
LWYISVATSTPATAVDSDPMPADSHKIILVERPGETSIHISAEIREDGDLQLSGQDIGKVPLEVFGDSDYEYWLRVPAAQKDLLLLALIEALYKGDVGAVSKLRALLEARKIPCEFSSY